MIKKVCAHQEQSQDWILKLIQPRQLSRFKGGGSRGPEWDRHPKISNHHSPSASTPKAA